MKFQKNTRRRALEYEKDLVNTWKEDKTFEKSIAQRPVEDSFVFYDGPPFLTGTPHHGHLLTSTIKDSVSRYQTMKGKRVDRVWGWDCHGLPAEVYTEKKLGIKGKPEILEYGLEKYILACRSNMVSTSDMWESTIDRIGRWVEFKGAYKTMDKEYMESVWWAFKTLYEKGKIYEGEKVLMYCTQDATPLSKAEVTMDAGSYKDVTDPSVYVKFKLKDQDAYLLAWTTTPWTLPANTAVAVNTDVQYAQVEVDGEHLIIAEDLFEKVLTNEQHKPLDYKVIKKLNGKELVGKSYEPLFENRGKNAHKIWHADYVSTEEGTGIVHLAPAYGEEDFALAKEKNFPVVSNIDDNGLYSEGEWQGENVWETNKPIAKELLARGIVWKIEYYRHSYPHCYRCGTRLMYRAHPSWFMDIEGQRQQMLEQNANINWFPEHIKHGRFENTITSAPDWNLSRDRFWASAMPVWKGVDKKGTEHIKVVGSYDELEKLSGARLDDYHRPWVDDVTFTINGILYKRVDKVLDCWFESGSMPFAQFHYPFENVEKFENNFPGDFIVEYVGQVRAWFYYVHAVSVGLFGKNAYKNVIVTGNIAGNDGRKMSKSYGNYTDPNELMDTYSADSLRLLLLQSPLLNGEDFALQDKEVGDVARKLGMVWNMFDFFTMYAEVDNWQWGGGNPKDPSASLTNPLDKWVISRVHEVSKHVDEHMQKYDIPNAIKPIFPLLDDASNWFVRRSRKRFWKSDNDTDKNDAYASLHYVLVQLSLILAPFTPFLADELYRKLTGGDSVHLQTWPEVGHINEMVISQMAEVRELITQGLALRAEAGIKVRQPLAGAIIVLKSGIPDSEWHEYRQILQEELNVKKVQIAKSGESITIDTKLNRELIAEGLARDIVRSVQSARKQAGLNIDDHIYLFVGSDSDGVKYALDLFGEYVATETLAVWSEVTDPIYTADSNIGGHNITIILAKQ